MNYKFSIKVYDIDNNFVVKVNIFFQCKLKILEGVAFNLAVVTELVNYLNDIMLNIMTSSDQELI